jgi:hypothetical protein
MSISVVKRMQRWQWVMAVAIIAVAVMFILVDGQGPRLRRAEYIPAPKSGSVAQWRFYFNQSVKDPSPDNVRLSAGRLYGVTTTNDVVTVQVLKTGPEPTEQHITIIDLQSKYGNRSSTITHVVRKPDTLFYTPAK